MTTGNQFGTNLIGENSSGLADRGQGAFGPLGMTPASQMEMLVSSGLNASSVQDLEMYQDMQKRLQRL